MGLLLASGTWKPGMLLCCLAPLNAQARPPYKPSTLWPQMFTSVTVEKSRLSGTRAISLSRPFLDSHFFLDFSAHWPLVQRQVRGICGVLAEARDQCQGTFVSM